MALERALPRNIRGVARTIFPVSIPMHLVLFGWKWGGEAGSTAHTMNLNVRKHVEEGGGGVYNDKKDNLDDEVWEGGREGKGTNHRVHAVHEQHANKNKRGERGPQSAVAWHWRQESIQQLEN